MRRILFSGDGSSGDLLPMVLMAREFKLAGYDVCVCGSSEYAQMARDFDVPFEGYPHQYSELYLKRQRTGYVHSIRENIRHQEMLFQGEYDLLSKIGRDFDVLVNFLAELFVPSIAEAFKLTNIKLFTFPMVRADRYAPPTGIPFITENTWLNRLHWAAAGFGAKYLFSYNKTINRLRAQLGLPPVDDLLVNNGRFDHMMIGLYPELMPPCESWRDIHYSYIGPCLPSARVRLSDALEAFLAQGPKPIYIGFGSMHHSDSDRLTRILLDAARDAGVRVILAANKSDLGASIRGSAEVFTLREYPIPHHVLFPRLKAVVHHGSWIATHLAARAGVPQLVLPQASDQYLWANVVRTHGLGPAGVDMNRLKPAKLATAIADLTQSARYEANARGFAARVKGIDGAKNALRLFERLEGRLAGKTTVAFGPSRTAALRARRNGWAMLSERYLGRRVATGSRADVRRFEMQHPHASSAALRSEDGDEAAGEG